MVDRALVTDDGPTGQQFVVLTPQGSIGVRAVPISNVAQGANRAYGVKGEIDVSPANGDTTAILAIATCKVRSSGIFLASVSCRYNSGAIPDAPQTLQWSVRTETGAGNVTLTNASKYGPSVPGGAGEGAFVSTQAAGILITAGGGDSVITQAQSALPLNASTLNGVYTWAAVVQNGADIDTETPFAVGRNVLLELLAPNTSVLAAMTIDEVCISLVEL